MKLEELIKEVVKLNKLNKKLCINKEYKVILFNRYKSFEFYKLDFKELESYFIDDIVDKLKERVFTRCNSSDTWQLDLVTKDGCLYFDLYIKECY